MSLPLIGFTRFSGNRKTGPIAVSTSSKVTCPDSCPLKRGGCYARIGKLNIHWDRVTKGAWGIAWKDFLSQVRKLHPGELWRHNQAGDLAGPSDKIDAKALAELTAANNGRKVICYTHKPVLSGRHAKANVEAIKSAMAGGFTINLSANSLRHADKLLSLKIAPVVTIVPSDTVKNLKTPAGNRVVICPAVTKEGVTCSSCKLCAWGKREYVIGFPSHGIMKKTVDRMAAIG